MNNCFYSIQLLLGEYKKLIDGVTYIFITVLFIGSLGACLQELSYTCSSYFTG